LIDTQGDPEWENQRNDLKKQAAELMNIFGAILRKRQ